MLETGCVIQCGCPDWVSLSYTTLDRACHVDFQPPLNIWLIYILYHHNCQPYFMDHSFREGIFYNCIIGGHLCSVCCKELKRFYGFLILLSFLCNILISWKDTTVFFWLNVCSAQFEYTVHGYVFLGWTSEIFMRIAIL